MDQKHRSIIGKYKHQLAMRINNCNKLRLILEEKDIFTNAMLKDIYDACSNHDLFVELTTRGPDAFHKFVQALKQAGYENEAALLENDSSEGKKPKRRLCYKMSSIPLGYCKIINNVRFDYLGYRFGSDEDALALEALFKTFGYVVDVEKNLSGHEMRVNLEEFAQMPWNSVDSCIIVILSHGDSENNTDIIYGTDSDIIRKTEIYEMFDSQNCPSLKNKPKMFFFQACRGNTEDDGVYYIESTDASKVVKSPSVSDMFIVHSALPNHLSYRDHDKGSWFGQDLVEVLTYDYLDHDLTTMLQSVARKVENRLSLQKKKQVIHIDLFGPKADVYFSMDRVADYCEIWHPNTGT